MAASEFASSKGTVLEMGLCFSRPIAWARAPQFAAALAQVTEADVDAAEKTLRPLAALSARADVAKVGETGECWSVQGSVLSPLACLFTLVETSHSEDGPGPARLQ